MEKDLSLSRGHLFVDLYPYRLRPTSFLGRNSILLFICVTQNVLVLAIGLTVLLG